MEIRLNSLEKTIIEHRASAVLYAFLTSKGQSGKYILPINICPIVPLVFKAANISIEYVDINNDDYCIDYTSVASLIKNKPSKYCGLLFNHTYGYEKSNTSFFKFLKELNNALIIIDDKCLCKPSLTADQYADLTLYSTGYAKYIDLEIGGIGVLNEMMQIRNFGKAFLTNDIIIEQNKFNPDFNEFLDEIAIESGKMEFHKELINSIYENNLNPNFFLGNKWNNWRFNLILPSGSDLVLKEIFNSGFFASKHYKPLLKNGFPNANMLYSKIINLFNDKHIDESKAISLAKVINNAIV